MKDMNHIEISVPNAVLDSECEIKLNGEKLRYWRGFSIEAMYQDILEVRITMLARVDGEFFLDGDEVVEQTLVMNGAPSIFTEPIEEED